MNGWTAAGAALLLCGAAPAGWAAATGPVRRRVVAQNSATTLLGLVVLLLARGFGRSAYEDPALVLAVLGPAGTLLYVRLLADELAAGPRPDPRALRAATLVNCTAVLAVVVPLCVVTGPGRALLKLLVIGVLLVLGSWVATRAVAAAGRGPAGV